MAGDTGSNVALNVVGSDILGNTGSGAKAAGGIATDTAGNFQGDQQMTIVNSLILGNIGNAVSGPEGEVAGGVAVLNEGVTNLTLTVKGSNISGNIGTGSNIVGGIALANVLDSNSTLQVKDSIISNNQGAGISAFNDGSGNFTATIDRSVVFGNTVGLNMDGPGTMMVKNPVFFNGVVNFSNGGVITFPGITPTNGQTVFCPFKAGTCSASAQ